MVPVGACLSACFGAPCRGLYQVSFWGIVALCVHTVYRAWCGVGLVYVSLRIKHMHIKKSLLATASVIVLAYATPVFTDDTDKVVTATGNMFIDTINKRGIFEWISGGVGYTDKTLNWDITAFSNLSETKDTVTYVQTSYNRQKSVNRLNLGLGYRKRIDTTADPLIVGVNAFFDSKDGTKDILTFKASDTFQRFSVGAELKTAQFDMAANLYRRIGNNIIDDKKVLQGWDITAKGSMPRYEQVSVGVNTYRFDGVGDTVVKGNKLIAEFTPNAMVTVRGEYDKPSGKSAQTDISVDFKLAFGKSIQDQLKSASVSGTDSVWHKRYDKVERHYDIKTAEVQEAQSAPTLGTAISSTDLATNKISGGDGTAETSAYTLQNGEQYDVEDFVGDIPDTLKTTGGVIDPTKVTVKVEQVDGDGEKGKDYELYASDGTVISLSEITADSKFTDIAGGKAATLKLTYSASGFEDRVVFVKAIAISQIGSVLSDSDKVSNTITGGDGSSQATAYTLTNAQTYDVKTFIGTVPTGVTPTVTAERVSGTSGTDFQFKNGGSDVTVGNATYTSTLEDKAGAGAAVIKLTYSAADFTDRVVYVQTNGAFAGSLTMADFVIPYAAGTATVSSADILGKLTVSGSQTQKSDWTIKSLADTDSHANLAIDSGGKSMTISGTISTKTTVTAVFEHPEYADQTKTFELSTGTGTLGGTPTGLSGKWGKTFTVDYKVKDSDTVGDVMVPFDTSADFTFSIVTGNVPSDAPSGTKATTTGILDTSKTAINASTGAIDGTALTKSGDLLVKIVRKAKGGLPELTAYENITVNKQVLGTDVTTIPTISNGGDNTWKTGNAKFDLTYSNLPGGLAANAFTWGVAKKSGAEPSGTLAIDSDGKISGATSAGTVVITLTAKGDKYSGSLTLADFAIAKQTGTDTLSMADLVISYESGDSDRTVTTAEIFGQLSVSSTGTAQTQASQWTLVSVADTDNNGDLAVTGGGKTLTISGEITTKTTVTAVLSHPAYANKTVALALSTEPWKISTGGRTGSGKWGKSYTTDYKIKSPIGGQTFKISDNDFTFSIVAAGGDDGSGKTQTTSGILDTSKTAINASTGVIDGSALTKSGTLLVKIVRKAKGSIDAVTEYQNFTVSKQDSSDHPSFAVTAGAIAWNANSQTVSYTENANKPAGISASPTYTLTASGTTAGVTSGANAITVASSDGKIGKTTKGGVVKVLVTYPANDKYETITKNIDVTVNKQAGTGALTMGAIVIPFGASDSSKPVTAAIITDKLTVPSSLGVKSDWTLTGLSKKDANSNITIDTGGKSLTISGAFTTSTTVTATFESDKYATRIADFELSTGAGTLSSGTRTGSGKWGKTFTTNYKLKTSDTVGEVSSTFNLNTDFTFSIVAPGTAITGFTSTTDGLVNGQLTGAIDGKTGAIFGNKLTKSGKLLIKIVRAARGGLPALTTYQNFDVSKQVLGTDVTTRPAVTTASSEDGKWKASGGKINLRYTLPGATTPSDYSWGVKPATSGGPSGTLTIDASGDISGATSGGTAEITITAKSDNKKYSGAIRTVDFAIKKQTVANNTLTVAPLVVTYAQGTKTVTAADILGKLSITTGSTKNDWTVQSLANTDSNTKVTVNGKTLNISGAIPTSTTITVVFESTKYTDVTKTFELSTRAVQVIDGTPTGLSGKWGKGMVTPDYKLDLTDQGQSFVKATDYTFSVVPSSDGGKGGKDATTAGIVTSGQNAIHNTKTGAIDSSKLIKSGKLLIKIVRAAKGAVAEATEYVNFDVTKQVLGTDVTTAPAVAKATGEDGKWKASGGKINLHYTLPGATTTSEYSWGVKPATSAGPSGTLTIDASGDISGATSGGTAQITITAKDNNAKYSGSMRTADFTIAKQVLASDVTTRPAVATATGEDGKWKSNTATKIALNYTLPGGTTASEYSWAIDKKSGAEPSGTLAIDQTNGHISGATSAGTAEITITAKSGNKKYSGSIRTADFTIAKQTTTDSLTMADLVISYASGDGNRTVSSAEILGQLSVSGGQTQKSEWTLVSVANTDNNGDLAVSGAGKTLTISDAITTKTTVTAVLAHPAYENKPVQFELSTEPSKISTSGRTGSGKWGKTYTTDYKLRSSVGSVNFVASDYTFSIVAAGGDDGSGKPQTTTGIVDGNDYTGAINIRTGAITGTKLTKSGTLLIKIVRAAKGTGAARVDAVTEYQNFTVSKQVLGTDVTTAAAVATATNEDGKWKADTSTKINLSYTLPGGTTASQYNWTVDKKASDAPDGTLAADGNGNISGATSAGTAEITLTAKGDNPKYSGSMRTADFAIAKQSLADSTKPTITSTNSKWKDNGGKIPLVFAGLPSGTAFGDYTWTAAGKTGDSPDTIAAGLKVESDGLTGATSGGTASITMTAKASNKKYSGNVNLADFTIAKQQSSDHTGFAVSATAIAWATASTAVSYTEANKPAGISAPTYTLIQAGTTAGTLAADGHGSVEVASADGKIAKTVRDGVVKVRLTYAANSKYEAMTRDVNVTINKQTATGTLKVTNLDIIYVSGTKTIRTADVINNLSITGGTSVKGDWTLKSLTDTDSHANLAIDSGGKSMTLSGPIGAGTTVSAVFESVKYTDTTASFEVFTSLGTLSTGTRTGSGKWGQKYSTDYKLNTADLGETFTTGASGDFTFSIVPSNNGDAGTGLTPTTAGIVAIGQTAIDSKTGDIEGTKLTKGGTLLVKIVRAAKGGLPILTEYQNFTVAKHNADDHKDFVVLASGIKWAAASTDVIYAAANPPAGIGTATYTLMNTGTTAGTLAGAVGSVAVASSNGAIAKTVRSGVVKVKVTYAANDKYEQIIRNVNVPIQRQAAPDVSGHTVTYTAAAWGNVVTPTHTGMPQVAGTDVYTPTYTRKSSTNGGSGVVNIEGIVELNGTISRTKNSGTITVTVAYPQNVRYEAATAQDVTVTVQRQSQDAKVKTGHTTWSTGRNGTPIFHGEGLISIYDALENIDGDIFTQKHVSITVEDAATGLSSGARYSNSAASITNTDYAFAFNFPASRITKSEAISEIGAGRDVSLWLRRTATANRAVKITFTFAETTDGKYAAGAAPLVTYWRTRTGR